MEEKEKMSYAEVATEINILFRYIDEELVVKVPQKIRDFLKSIASPTYVSKIDPRFPLDDQYLLPETEILLSVLHHEFWATKEQRAELDILLSDNENLLNEEYDVDKLFNKVEEIKKNKVTAKTNESPTVVDSTPWYINCVNIFKTIVNKLFNNK